MLLYTTRLTLRDKVVVRIQTVLYVRGHNTICIFQLLGCVWNLDSENSSGIILFEWIVHAKLKKTRILKSRSAQCIFDLMLEVLNASSIWCFFLCFEKTWIHFHYVPLHLVPNIWSLFTFIYSMEFSFPYRWLRIWLHICHWNNLLTKYGIFNL